MSSAADKVNPALLDALGDMSMLELAAHAAAIKLLADRIDAAHETTRAVLRGRMLAERRERGSKSMDVTIDGEVLGSISMTRPRKPVVIDPAAQMRWVKERSGIPDATEEVLRESTKMLLSARIRVEGGVVVDSETKEILPWAEPPDPLSGHPAITSLDTDALVYHLTAGVLSDITGLVLGLE